MAEISKSIAAAHGMRAHLVPARTREQLSARALEERLDYAADLAARGDSCGDRTLASCYHQVAKAVLTALPRAEVVQKARDLRAKAAQLGRGGPADMLRRQADDLEAANPQPPPRASVRKAADGPTLTALYDCNGEIFGVAEAEDIVPALDPDVIAKASSAGMVATHDPATGKAIGFVDPEAIQEVTTDMSGIGKPGKTGDPAGKGGPATVSPGRR